MFVCTVLFLLQAATVQPESKLTHATLNAEGSAAFLEVLKAFRAFSASAPAATTETPIAGGFTTDNLEKLGKLEAAEELAKKHGFVDLRSWQVYGARLFAAIQRVQIGVVTTEARKRLESASDSERDGLKAHIASLEAAAQQIQFVTPLNSDEQNYVAANVTPLSREIAQVSSKPQD
jgi:hypothetical protein